MAFLATALLTAFFATALRTAFFATAFLTAFLATAFLTAFFATRLRTAFLATAFLTAFFATRFLTAFLATAFLTAFLLNVGIFLNLMVIRKWNDFACKRGLITGYAIHVCCEIILMNGNMLAKKLMILYEITRMVFCDQAQLNSAVFHLVIEIYQFKIIGSVLKLN
jgi:hypothetical protein